VQVAEPAMTYDLPDSLKHFEAALRVRFVETRSAFAGLLRSTVGQRVLPWFGVIGPAFPRLVHLCKEAFQRGASLSNAVSQHRRRP
jgi:hypothetical protein